MDARCQAQTFNPTFGIIIGGWTITAAFMTVSIKPTRSQTTLIFIQPLISKTIKLDRSKNLILVGKSYN